MIIMTQKEFLLMKQKYTEIVELNDKIEAIQREIKTLENIDGLGIKNCFYQKIFPFLIIDHEEFDMEKLMCEKIINYMINYRKKRLKYLQKQFEKL